MRPDVVVAGRVMRVRPRPNGGWRLRLSDTGGALLAAEISPTRPIAIPLPGSRIVLRGALRYDAEHQWYTVDPVLAWRLQ